MFNIQREKLNAFSERTKFIKSFHPQIFYKY